MNPRIFPLLILCTAVCAMAGGCASHGKKTTEPQHQLVGTILLVNEAGRFAVIDTGTSVAPLPGQALKSFTGGQESGVLTVNPERRPPFITADIVQGSPQKGDLVYE